MSEGATEPLPLPEGALRAISEMADGKFRAWEWTLGKSPLTAFHVSRKFACGTVEASFDIREGRIRSLAFGGDFLGNRPSQELSSRLEGCRFDTSGISAVLEDLKQKGESVKEYFDGLSENDLMDLLLSL